MFLKRLANGNENLAGFDQRKEKNFSAAFMGLSTATAPPIEVHSFHGGSCFEEEGSIDSGKSEAGTLKSTKGMHTITSCQPEEGELDDKHKQSSTRFSNLKQIVIESAFCSIYPIMKSNYQALEEFKGLLSLDKILAKALFPIIPFNFESEEMDTFAVFHSEFITNEVKNKYSNYFIFLKDLIAVLKQSPSDFESFEKLLKAQCKDTKYFDFEALKGFFDSQIHLQPAKKCFLDTMIQLDKEKILIPALKSILKMFAQVEKTVNLLYLGACTNSDSYASLVILLEYLFDDTADQKKYADRPEAITAFRNIATFLIEDNRHYISSLFTLNEESVELDKAYPRFYKPGFSIHNAQLPLFMLYFPVIFARSLVSLMAVSNYSKLPKSEKLEYVKGKLLENFKDKKDELEIWDIVDPFNLEDYLCKHLDEDKVFWHTLAQVHLPDSLRVEKDETPGKFLIGKEIFFRMRQSFGVLDLLNRKQVEIAKSLGVPKGAKKVLKQYFCATEIEQQRRLMPWPQQLGLPKVESTGSSSSKQDILKENIRIMTIKYLSLRYTAAGARTCVEAQVQEECKNKKNKALFYQSVNFFERFNDYLEQQKSRLAESEEKEALQDELKLWSLLKIYDVANVLIISEVNDRIPTEYKENDPGTLSGTLFETVMYSFDIGFDQCYQFLRWYDQIKRYIVLKDRSSEIDSNESYFVYRDLDPNYILKKAIDFGLVNEDSKGFLVLQALTDIEKNFVIPILNHHELQNKRIKLMIDDQISSLQNNHVLFNLSHLIKDAYDGWNKKEDITGNEIFHWLNPKKAQLLPFADELSKSLIDQVGLPINFSPSLIKGRYFREWSALDKAAKISSFKLECDDILYEKVMHLNSFLKTLDLSFFDLKALSDYLCLGSQPNFLSFFDFDPSNSASEIANSSFASSIQNVMDSVNSSILLEQNLKELNQHTPYYNSEKISEELSKFENTIDFKDNAHFQRNLEILKHLAQPFLSINQKLLDSIKKYFPKFLLNVKQLCTYFITNYFPQSSRNKNTMQ